MSSQLKISASLQEAQRYMAECLEFVTHYEPFVLEFNDSSGAYAQAIRDSRLQMCVEISGPESIEGKLASGVEAKLGDLGWGMPRQSDADTPNFWREYPKDADLKLIARDTILGVAVAFPDAKFSGTGDPILSMDEAIELLEDGQRVHIQPQTPSSEPQAKEEFYSAWQNYQAAHFRCSKCKKDWLGDKLENDFQGLVLTLRCPKCHRKLIHLGVEASIEEVHRFAEEGSPTAIEHLEMMAQWRARQENQKDAE
jgi:hypothetical protein